MPTSPIASVDAVNVDQLQLPQSTSQRSVTASDDYYSFSDISPSSSRSKVTVVRYATPPSRHLSPSANTDNQAEMASPPARPSLAVDPAVATMAQAVRRDDDRRPAPIPNDDRSTNNGTPTPGVDDTPYIRFAIDQLTRDEEVEGSGRGSLDTDDYPVERMIPDEGLGYYTPFSTTRQTRTVRDRPSPAPSGSPAPEILLAVDAPEDSFRYPQLDFVPFILHPFTLTILAMLCLLMIALLVFCSVWSQRHDGLLDYDGLGGTRYFLFEFLPQLLAALIITWLFAVQSAVYRIAPFSIMASVRPLGQALQRLSVTPKNFVFPDLAHFRYGEPLVAVCLLIIWLINFITIPLQSCLFQTRFVTGVQAFRWVTVQAVSWTLVALYGLLVGAIVALIYRFGRRYSGLMWDPVCLADIIPLIQRSSILHHFDRSETAPAVQTLIPPRTLRLGYWRTSSHPDVFYAIGEEYATLPKAFFDHAKQRERRPGLLMTGEYDIEQPQLSARDSFERDLHNPFVRDRWTIWFLRDTFVVAWIVIALVLLVAFIVVSFSRGAIRRGFLPLLPTLSSPSGFSASNFLYSFIPSLIGNILFLAWQPIDLYFRAIQPFTNLKTPNGTPAEHSLLLSYPSCLPLEVTFLALASGHYKVAYCSFMSLASLVIPVLAGGVFMAEFYRPQNQVRISAFLPAYHTLVAFVIIYALSFLVIWPRSKRYLPHSLTTYADIISFLYQSPLLADKLFREPRTKAALVTMTMAAPPGQGDHALYAFGVYRGRDGREHLGIDRLSRGGQADMLVTTGR